MKRMTALLLVFCMAVSLFIPCISWGQGDSSMTVQQSIQALGIITGDEHGNLNLSANVTRAEFAKMMVAASAYKDSVGSVSGVSSFKDVKYSHWAAGYVKLAVDAGWIVGYVDGTFRPNNTIKLEEASTAVLRMLGYTTAELVGTYPSAQIAKYQALSLNKNISKTLGQFMSRMDCMNLFYNLMGAKTNNGSIYGSTLGYAVNSAGEIDFSSIVAEGMEGPFVIDNSASWTSSLPFSFSSATVYKNGRLADRSSASLYDVYYYSPNMRTIWLYNDKVTGLYTAASPNSAAPSSVTIAGNSYKLGTSAAVYQMSAMGDFTIGDTVTLLLGMNGDVVRVLSTSQVVDTVYGVVTEVGTQTYSNNSSTSTTEYTVTVACTDGVSRQYATSNTYYSVGTLVSAGYEKGSTVVKSLSSRGLSGTFSNDGKSFAGYTLSTNPRIIDTDEDGNYKVIYPSRLAGSTLANKDVKYYVTDANNQISDLILNDATGDLHSYGIVISATEADQDYSVFGNYRFLINGKEVMLNSTNTKFNASKGPALFLYKGNELKSIRSLSKTPVSSINSLQITSSNKTYPLAEDVQVYLYKDGDYHFSALNTVVNSSSYNLEGYYDTGFNAGNRIRILIAKDK